MKAYRGLVAAFAVTFIGIGFGLLVVTALHGGGFSLGYLLGVLFVALGAGRLTLLRRR